MTTLQPSGNGGAEIIEFAGIEMVSVRDDDHAVLAGQGRNDFFDFVDRAVFVVFAVDEEFRFGTVSQITEVGIVDRDAEADEVGNASVLAAHTKANPTSKAEARKQQRDAGKFLRQEIQCGTNIVLFAQPSIMRSGTHSGAAKIESQYGHAERVKRFSSLIDNLVVQRSAEERVRVANHGRQDGSSWPHGCP